jgi:hypothetical protein
VNRANAHSIIGLAVSTAIAGLLPLVLPPAAGAHTAIRLDIRAPAPDAVVSRHTDAIIAAQPMLGDQASVSFTATIDGTGVDPRTGRPTRRLRAVRIAASRTRHIPLRSLTAGTHQLSIVYRPDMDEPVTSTTVEFSIAPAER